MGLKSFLKKLSKPKASVFVDFEHWLYSLNNLYGLTPRVKEFYNEISEKYNVKRIYFFGDFSEPKMSACLDEIRQVTNNVIDTKNPSPHIKKDYTDFIMLDYIYQDCDDHPKTDTYIIFSGDGHFSSAAANLKNKKKKNIVIYGIADATSHKLQEIADECHILPSGEEETALYRRMVLDSLDYLASRPNIRYATFRKTAQKVAERNNVPEDKIVVALQDLIGQGILKQEYTISEFNREVKVLKTDWQLAAEKGLWNFSDARPVVAHA